MIDSFEQQHIDAFNEDGFLVIEQGFISQEAIDQLRTRFDRLFDEEYETGIKPDEVNWVRGRDPEDRTRQICNGWRADDRIASQVLSERTGRLAAQLMGFDGVRLLQDNVIWKPPGTKALGSHQDNSYAAYLVPPQMVTCWIALDDTKAGAGPIEFVRGSHKWGVSPPARGDFHAPADWLAPARAAAPPDWGELETVPVVVKAGGASFHHGSVWHGSAPNTSTELQRRALISHMIPATTKFHPVHADLIYSRYRKRGDLSLDESFFPIMWDRSGARSQWLAGLPQTT